MTTPVRRVIKRNYFPTTYYDVSHLFKNCDKIKKIKTDNIKPHIPDIKTPRLPYDKKNHIHRI